MMHGHEKSDPAIVAKKPTNKAGQPASEPVERSAGGQGERGAAKYAPGTGPGKRDPGAGPRKASLQGKGKRRSSPRSSTISVSIPMLRTAFYELKREAAPGVDGLTWQD